MSRIGKQPISVPAGVTAELNGAELSMKGPKGLLSMQMLKEVIVDIHESEIVVRPVELSKTALSIWGMQRTLVQNLVDGVTTGFSRKLEINGVGYRAALKGNILNLQLGFSHDVNFPIPEGIKIECPDQTTVIISGIDKQQVGQVAAKIREYRKPEPYKGKGIKYEGEYIFRKEGKKK
jgi:large subunit ribosomal protein L6